MDNIIKLLNNIGMSDKIMKSMRFDPDLSMLQYRDLHTVKQDTIQVQGFKIINLKQIIITM